MAATISSLELNFRFDSVLITLPLFKNLPLLKFLTDPFTWITLIVSCEREPKEMIIKRKRKDKEDMDLKFFFPNLINDLKPCELSIAEFEL